MSRNRKNRMDGRKPSNRGKVEKTPLREDTDSNDVLVVIQHRRRGVFPVVARLSFFFFMFWFWSFRYRDFLFMAQEYDLFVWDLEYLIESGSRVAGLSRWYSSLLLQFFYYPLVGGTLMASSLSFIQCATEKLFGLKRRLFFLSFILPCILTLQITSVNYFFFERFDLAYLFSFTFNYVFIFAYVLLFEWFRCNRPSFPFIVIGLVLTYPIWGFFSLLASFLCLAKSLHQTALHNKQTIPKKSAARGTKSLKNGNKTRNSEFETIKFFALFTLLVPIIYWLPYSNSSPSLQHMYVAGLLEESPLTQGRDETTRFIFSLWTTFTIIFLTVLTLFDVFRRWFALRRSKKNALKSTNPKTPCNFDVVFSSILISIICVITVYASFSASNFLQFLKIARELDKENWLGVLDAESSIRTPSSSAITARLLALSRLGRLADEAFLRPAYPETSQQLLRVQTFGMCGDRILLELGLTNCAERVAFNNYVVKRERTFWSLKTLALCAVVDGRRSLAERYLFRIRKTLFHKKFAEEALDYIETYDNQSSSYAYLSTAKRKTSNARLVKFDEHINAIKILAPLTDNLAFSETTISAYFGMIQDEDISKRDVKETENRLAFLLIMRNLPQFSAHFDDYLKRKTNGIIPQSFQEAALLRERFPSAFKPNESSWSLSETVQIDPTIRKRFERYLEIVSDSNMDVARKLMSVQSEFGDTFWGFISTPETVDYY